MADEKFSIAEVSMKMNTIEDLFAAFADTLNSINSFVESNVNASLASSAYGDLGGKLLSMWNYNSATFEDFHNNFDNWAQVVAIITANNNKFAVDAQATYRDNVGTLDGVKEARDFISKSNGLANVATTDGFNTLSSDARSVLDAAYRAKTETVSKNNTYQGKTISYTDAAGNKIEIYYDEEGNLVGKKITDTHGNTKYYNNKGENIDKLPTNEEYEAERQKKLEELEKLNSYYKNHLDDLKFGSYELKTFKASNGITVKYWVYMPDYGRNVDGLPVHIYLHGSGETTGGTNKIGLPKMLNEQSTTPEGIVICPQASSGKDFYNANYQQALIELAQTTAKDNGGDTNKISLSGHSMGAIAGYKMVANNPNTFSAFVPISGLSYMNEKVKDSGTSVWIFHGNRDGNCEYSNAVQTYNYLKGQGADVSMHTFDAGHGGVQNYTWQQEYTNSAGETINPLTWAFDQSLDKTSNA